MNIAKEKINIFTTRFSKEFILNCCIVVCVVLLSSLLLFLVFSPADQRPKKPPRLEAGLLGSPLDSVPDVPLKANWLFLMGGGSDVSEAFSEFAFPKIMGGNVLILRESGTAAYNDFFAKIAQPKTLASVETIIVSSKEHANSEYVSWAIDHAEMIWFGGGNQTNVLEAWRGTALQKHVQLAIDRGIILGGTSSGLTILSEEIYAPPAEYRGSTGEEALLDPYNTRMTTEDKFLDFPQFSDIKILIDGHTIQRERQGRAMALLSRMIVEEQDFSWKMLALDEATAVFVNPDSEGLVISENPDSVVLLLCADDNTTFNVVEAGQPLNVSDLAVWEFRNGERIDLMRNPRTQPKRYSSFGDGKFIVTEPGAIRQDEEAGEQEFNPPP